MKTCGWCHEEIKPGEALAPYTKNSVHWECGVRSVVGGVNHLNRTCTCCGGTQDPDPPGVTRREAARLAMEAWEAGAP